MPGARCSGLLLDQSIVVALVDCRVVRSSCVICWVDASSVAGKSRYASLLGMDNLNYSAQRSELWRCPPDRVSSLPAPITLHFPYRIKVEYHITSRKKASGVVHCFSGTFFLHLVFVVACLLTASGQARAKPRKLLDGAHVRHSLDGSRAR